MALADTAAPTLAQNLRTQLTRATSSFWLRAADIVGHNPKVIGRPHVWSGGALRIGSDFQLGSRPAQSHLVVASGATMIVGDRVLISYGAAISAQLDIRIDDDTSIGPYAVIMDSDFHVAGDRHAAAQPAPIHIGKRVVVGSRVTILRGTTIGDDVRVASGSVVSGAVASGSVVAGVPARAVTDGALGDSADLPGLVMRVLALTSPPTPDMGPNDISQWDSLGSLKLLLAIEEAFDLTLNEDQVASARSVARLAEIVEAARKKKERPDPAIV
jgi:acetyltransferase-like isoleucine patch superfamily enzyme/acyl carrier protein